MSLCPGPGAKETCRSTSLDMSPNCRLRRARFSLLASLVPNIPSRTRTRSRKYHVPGIMYRRGGWILLAGDIGSRTDVTCGSVLRTRVAWARCSSHSLKTSVGTCLRRSSPVKENPTQTVKAYKVGGFLSLIFPMLGTSRIAP